MTLDVRARSGLPSVRRRSPRLAPINRVPSPRRLPELPWPLRLNQDQLARLMEFWLPLAGYLNRYLVATRPEVAARDLNEALATAAQWGRSAERLDLSLSQSVECFLSFLAPIRDELAVSARRPPHALAAAEPQDAAALAIDRLLLAMTRGHIMARPSEIVSRPIGRPGRSTGA
jgi:hypothetical protein